MRSILVVGGSGMLAGACAAWAAEGHDVGVIARGRARLEQMAADHPGIIPVPCDYTDAAALASSIEAFLYRAKTVDRVVAWIRSTAPHATAAIAEVLRAHGCRGRWYEVLGSSSADPRTAPPRDADVAPFAYHRILLGYEWESGMARWLTDAEICDGIRRAFRDDLKDHIVGHIEPWNSRP